MNRFALVVAVIVVSTFPAYGQVTKQTGNDTTWYEQALRHLNPNDIDYGSIWEQRKRAILDQVGSPYFQYSFVANGRGCCIARSAVCSAHE